MSERRRRCQQLSDICRDSRRALYNFSVRAAAIPHSYVKQNVVEPFFDARVNVFRGNTLETNDLPDVAIVFGGDGSVHRVLASLAHTETPLLVVPTGCEMILRAVSAFRIGARRCVPGIDIWIVATMCAPSTSGRCAPWLTPARQDDRAAQFRRCPGRISRRASRLAPVIMRNYMTPKRRRRLRVIYFSGIAGVGLDAETNRRANRCRAGAPPWRLYRRRLGALADYFRRWCVCTAMTPAGRRPVCTVRCFRRSWQHSRVWQRNKDAAEAKLDDGQLDLCFVPAMSKRFVLRHFHRIDSGTHLLVPEVRYFRTRQVFVESDEPVAIYADGEYLCQTPAEISAGSQGVARHRSIDIFPSSRKTSIPDS